MINRPACAYSLQTFEKGIRCELASRFQLEPA
jgi:hypothetical protein